MKKDIKRLAYIEWCKGIHTKNDTYASWEKAFILGYDLCKKRNNTVKDIIEEAYENSTTGKLLDSDIESCMIELANIAINKTFDIFINEVAGKEDVEYFEEQVEKIKKGLYGEKYIDTRSE